MTKRRTGIIAAVLLVSGCGADSDIGARYHLERAYHEARQVERRAYATYPVDSYHEWRAARDAYNRVLLSNPAHIPESVNWNPGIVARMERVALAAEIGLLRLDVVDYRFHELVTHRANPSSASPELLGRVIVKQVPALYDSLGAGPVGNRAARRLRTVVSNPLLWSDPTLLRDSLLAAPSALMNRTQESTASAEGFYSRVIASWPDSVSAIRARDYRARVRIARGEMEDALVDVEVAAATHPDPKRRAELELTRSDLLGFSLDRSNEATAILRRLVERDPGGDAAWWARVRLALLDPPPDVTVEDRLRVIHMDARAPYEVAAAAMFARAATVESGGNWGEASELFWRLTQRYPDSMPALAAPLHVIRTLMAQRDRSGASSALKRAVEYYTRVIKRDSAALEPRHLPKDCLLEAYLLLGRPEDAVIALQNAVEGTSPDNRVATALKVALIRDNLVGDPENAVEILKKSLELFPRSRYARCVRWKLQRMREARDG